MSVTARGLVIRLSAVHAFSYLLISAFAWLCKDTATVERCLHYDTRTAYMYAVQYDVHVRCSLHAAHARCFQHVWNNARVRRTCAMNVPYMYAVHVL